VIPSVLAVHVAVNAWSAQKPKENRINMRLIAPLNTFNDVISNRFSLPLGDSPILQCLKDESLDCAVIPKPLGPAGIGLRSKG